MSALIERLHLPKLLKPLLRLRPVHLHLDMRAERPGRLRPCDSVRGYSKKFRHVETGK